MGFLLWTQGLYYFLTGIWPIVDIRSFQAVTGKKTDHIPTGLESDHWLVMTVSVLVVAIGLTLLVGAVRRSQSLELAFLAMSAACGLISIDVIYWARGVLQPVYLLDAAIQVFLVVAWSVVLLWGRLSERLSSPVPRPSIPNAPIPVRRVSKPPE